jgi:hypothetical protein
VVVVGGVAALLQQKKTDLGSLGQQVKSRHAQQEAPASSHRKASLFDGMDS